VEYLSILSKPVQALKVLYLLLPGFVTARIVQSLTVRKSQTELDKIIEALFFSFLIYVIFSFTESQLKWIPGSEIVQLFFLTLVTGVVWSILIHKDYLLRLVRRLKWTKKTSGASVWSDVFNEPPKPILIEFTDGRRIIGMPDQFSETPEEGTLFLKKAKWIIGENDKATLRTPGLLIEEKGLKIKSTGILITKEFPIRSITFLERVPEKIKDEDSSK
jgi:hypothetical protein